MAKIRVKYLIQKGNRFYWQPSTRLRILGWAAVKLSATLEAAIAEAQLLNQKLDKWREGDGEAGQEASPDSVHNLILKYKKSPAYKKLAPSTKKGYNGRLELIDKWAGKFPVSAISRQSVKNLYEKLAQQSLWKANDTIRILRLLLQYAVDESWIPGNPATRPNLISPEQRDKVWSQEHEAKMIEIADKKGWYSIGTTICLAAYIGQREGDLLKLTDREYDGTNFRIRQNKTKKWIEVPAHPKLKERLDKYANPHGYLITREYDGKPYGKDYFGRKFALIRKEAAKEMPEIAKFKFLDFRRTSIVRLAEAGCTDAEISAVSGHKIDTCHRILEVYLPRNGKMASNAIRKLELAA